MKEPRKKLPRILAVLAGAFLVLSVIGVVLTWTSKKHARAAAAKERGAATDQGPVVLVADVVEGPSFRDVSFTGDVRGYYQTTLYAKVSGYVLDVRVDKGDHVTTGQILGRIESPELDQSLISAQSGELLRKQLADRARLLAPSIVAEQDLETASSNLKVSHALVGSAAAMKAYELIRAPFDGVITARYVDPGALMPAATGGTQSALPFVDLAVTDRLRVDIYVPQNVASFVRLGDEVSLSEDERPDLVVPGAVMRFAGALDPRTRTMLVEIDVDNRFYGLLPGTFATVKLHVEAPSFPTVPAEALLVRDGKNLVAKVEGNKVHLVEVQPGDTDGQTLEIKKGLSPKDIVALNLPAEVDDGATIRAKRKPKKANAPPKGGKPT